MQINLEAPSQHSIQSYHDKHIMVNGISYLESVLITATNIIPNWPIQSISDLTLACFEPILSENIEIIIIGHNQSTMQLPIDVLEQLSKRRIGIECMSIGAASRTFNVLLSEYRAVAIGIILN